MNRRVHTPCKSPKPHSHQLIANRLGLVEPARGDRCFSGRGRSFATPGGTIQFHLWTRNAFNVPTSPRRSDGYRNMWHWEMHEVFFSPPRNAILRVYYFCCVVRSTCIKNGYHLATTDLNVLATMTLLLYPNRHQLFDENVSSQHATITTIPTHLLRATKIYRCGRGRGCTATT